MTGTLGLYVHVPFCVQKCDYCNFYSVPLAEQDAETLEKAFLLALRHEIENHVLSGKGVKVDSLYLGGGTPSLLGHQALRSILQCVSDAFSIQDDAEISIECNPRDCSREKFLALRDIGFNRMTLGVQTLQPELYRMLGRQGGGCSTDVLKDFSSIDGVVQCLDLMVGIPGQTVESLREDLATLVSFHPHHLSVYLLSVEKGTPLAGRFQPDDGFDLFQKELFQYVIDFLRSNGYQHYEVSNFARNSFFSRHNLKYWTFLPYLGFGPGSHSFFNQQRWSNPSDFSHYVRHNGLVAVEDKRDRDSEIVEFFMTGLRLRKGVSVQRFETIFNAAIPRPVEDRFALLEKRGLIARCSQEGEAYIHITDAGFFYTDAIIYEVVEPLL